MDRYTLGLHTDIERKKAYAKARQEYQRALHDIEKYGKHYPGYALGYITATMDIAKAEDNPDREFIKIMDDWVERLIEASGIGQDA